MNCKLTHCKRGHEFNNVNTYIRKNGTRKCRACQLKPRQPIPLEKRLEDRRIWRRNYQFKRNYGITSNEVNNMLEEQKYLCKVCKKNKYLVVDHCHKSKRIRGMLCNQCNHGIGLFYDSPELLRQAIIYLEG